MVMQARPARSAGGDGTGRARCDRPSGPCGPASAAVLTWTSGRARSSVPAAPPRRRTPAPPALRTWTRSRTRLARCPFHTSSSIAARSAQCSGLRQGFQRVPPACPPAATGPKASAGTHRDSGPSRPDPAVGLSPVPHRQASGRAMRGREIPGSWPDPVPVLSRSWPVSPQPSEFGPLRPPTRPPIPHHQDSKPLDVRNNVRRPPRPLSLSVEPVSHCGPRQGPAAGTWLTARGTS